MSTTNTSTINTSFSGGIPDTYDRYLGPIFFDCYADDLVERLRPLAPKSILELACGTGRVTRQLHAAFGGTASITATDLSPDMLRTAQRLTAADGIQWEAVDAVSLPYADNSFDAVVCQFGIMFVPDKPKAYREAMRVLKPGGTMIVNTWDAIEYNPIIDIADKRLTKFFGPDGPKFYSIPFGYYDESVIRDHLMQAGIGDAKIETVSLEGNSPSAADAAKGLTQGTPVVMELQSHGADALEVISKQLAEDIVAAFGPGAFTDPLRAKVITARKP
ncbi:MAG: class I SAM-dependent methyltransferase [Bacteroidetes bacterium]|nr:class I SAM-dependent methyltransferase [Bacteroidota bacterium]